jgi:signal transduction histidine kinase
VDGVFRKEAEIGVFRIVQESVNNIVKHSGATEATIELVRDGSRVRLRVTDNGRGFLVDLVAGGSERRGFGLAGMQERVTMLNGTRTIESTPGRGTTVSNDLPLTQESRSGA